MVHLFWAVCECVCQPGHQSHRCSHIQPPSVGQSWHSRLLDTEGRGLIPGMPAVKVIQAWTNHASLVGAVILSRSLSQQCFVASLPMEFASSRRPARSDEAPDGRIIMTPMLVLVLVIKSNQNHGFSPKPNRNWPTSASVKLQQHYWDRHLLWEDQQNVNKLVK